LGGLLTSRENYFCDKGHIFQGNYNNIITILAVSVCRFDSAARKCGLNHMRHAVSGLDFLTFLCYTFSIR
jgi:hypothetical protein